MVRDEKSYNSISILSGKPFIKYGLQTKKAP